MRRVSSLHRVPLCGALCVVFSVSLPQAAAAQETGALRGRVEDATTGRPIAGVRIAVQGTVFETLTARDGTYQIDEVPAGPVNIRLEFPLYATSTERVTVRPNRVTEADFLLLRMRYALDELNIQARAYQRPAATTAAEVLTSSRTGVSVSRGTGQVGTGSRILLRGVNSFSLSNDPIIYVDGVRVSNTLHTVGASAPVGLSILDIIPADLIEWIEVLRGPAAAAQFGLGAANGVILIHTKGGVWSKKPKNPR